MVILQYALIGKLKMSTFEGTYTKKKLEMKGLRRPKKSKTWERYCPWKYILKAQRYLWKQRIAIKQFNLCECYETFIFYILLQFSLAVRGEPEKKGTCDQIKINCKISFNINSGSWKHSLGILFCKWHQK